MIRFSEKIKHRKPLSITIPGIMIRYITKNNIDIEVLIIEKIIDFFTDLFFFEVCRKKLTNSFLLTNIHSLRSLQLI